MCGNATPALLYMNQMFKNCSTLTSIQFPPTFNTSRVTNMYGVFLYCEGLTSISIPSFSTSSTTNMESMFNGCKSLQSLTLGPAFTAGSATNMRRMFKDCRGLSTLDLSNFNTSQVTDMQEMFSECRSLTSLTLGSNFTMNAVSSYGSMLKNLGYNSSSTTVTCMNSDTKTFLEEHGGSSGTNAPSYVVYVYSSGSSKK